MLKKLILTAAAGAALLSTSAFADNGWHRGWYKGHRPHGHVYYAPRPVVVMPPPRVVVAPPPPVYYSAPAPVFYPAPVAYPAPAPVYADPSVSIRLRLPL